MTPAQLRFVTHLRGGVLLQPPVGTGKTLGLAERAAHVIRAGIPPARILCARILREEAGTLGLPQEFSICDEVDGADLVRAERPAGDARAAQFPGRGWPRRSGITR